jgi:hypothetical protein
MNAKEKVIAENRVTALHSPRMRARRYEDEDAESERHEVRPQRKFMPAAMYFPLNLKKQLFASRQRMPSKTIHPARRHPPTTLQLDRGTKHKHSAHKN